MDFSHRSCHASHCQVITRHVSIQMKRLKVVEFIRCLDLKYCEGIGLWIVLVLHLWLCDGHHEQHPHLLHQQFFRTHYAGCFSCPQVPPSLVLLDWTASIGGQPPVVVCGPLMMWNLSAGMISPPNFNLGPPFFLRKVDPDERIHAKNGCFFHNQESRPKVRIPKVRLRNWKWNIYIYTTAKKNRSWQMTLKQPNWKIRRISNISHTEVCFCRETRRNGVPWDPKVGREDPRTNHCDCGGDIGHGTFHVQKLWKTPKVHDPLDMIICLFCVSE